MKKTVFPIVLPLFALMFILSCGKRDVEEPAENPILPSLMSELRGPTEPVGNSMVIWMSEYFNDTRPLCGGSFSGTFYNGAERINAGSLLIGGQSVPYLNSGKQYQRQVGGDYTNSPAICGLYGSNVSSSVSGNLVFPATNGNIYLPKKMQVTAGLSSGYFSKSSNLVLNWQADPTNPNGKVYIIIATDLPGSQPNPSAIVIETADDGNHVVSSSNFSQFQTGGTAVVHCGRGNIATIVQGGQKIEVTALVDAKAGQLDVID
jgi:hypothetical protein